MPLSSFQKQLENDLKKNVKLTINDNRSTMLSIKWEPDCTKVSLHRFFLRAPENVMRALACYIKQEHLSVAPTVKSFMKDSIRSLDYSHLLDKKKLKVQGKFYDLQHLLNDLNQEYFDNTLNLNITWFGKPYQCNRTQVTFGLYQESLKLIKINRLLDDPNFPKYLVSYVIYHEMLHNVCSSYYDERGRHRIHNKEFKAMEVKFRHYDRAQQWIKENKKSLFSKR